MKNLWENDLIQFARLIAELRASGALTETVWDELLSAMDLESEDLAELFDRADKVWEKSKEENCPVHPPELCGYCNKVIDWNFGKPLGCVDCDGLFCNLHCLDSHRCQENGDEDPLCDSCGHPASEHSGGSDDFSHCPNDKIGGESIYDYHKRKLKKEENE